MTVRDLSALRGELQTAFLARLTVALEADGRVTGAWLMGSFGRGENDAWSDFDLHVAIADESWDDFNRDRLPFYRTLGEPILIQEEMPSNAVAGGIFQLVLYDEAIEVDWNFVPASLATRPVTSLPLVGAVPPPNPGLTLNGEQRAAALTRRLTFAWAMAPIAVKYIARGDLVRAVNQFDLIVHHGLWPVWALTHSDGPVALRLDEDNPIIPRELKQSPAEHITAAFCLVELERVLRTLEGCMRAPRRMADRYRLPQSKQSGRSSVACRKPDFPRNVLVFALKSSGASHGATIGADSTWREYPLHERFLWQPPC